MMTRKYIALTALAALFAAPAFATEHEGWIYNGLTGMGSVHEDGLRDSAFSSNSNIGYRWGMFGVEVGHVYFGKFKDSSQVGAATVNVDTKVDGWSVGVNVNHDIDEKWSLQGRLGLFDWNADGHVFSGPGSIPFSDSGHDWYAGASIDYNWRKRSSVGFGYSYYKVNNANINLWGIHTEYRFGSD